MRMGGRIYVREVEIARHVDWVMKQVAPTFANVIDVIGDEHMKFILDEMDV